MDTMHVEVYLDTSKLAWNKALYVREDDGTKTLVATGNEQDRKHIMMERWTLKAE